jgi:hypothetical protein
LLTFRNIGANEFPRAQQAALDLQTTFGDLNTASVMLGKALNDPIKGVTALGRAGVTFSQEQKDQIKYFTETNQLAKAQEIILSEVEHQVGGTAAAMNAASDGSDNLTVAWENMMEAIGQDLIQPRSEWNQFWTDFADGMNRGITSRQNHKQAVEDEKKALKDNGIEWQFVNGWMKDGVRITEAHKNAILIDAQACHVQEGAIAGVGESAELTAEQIQDAADAMDALSKTQLSITASVTSAENNFNDTYKKLMKERAQLELDRITASGDTLVKIKSDLAANSEALQKNVDDYDLATNKIILDYATQLLAADGLTTEEANYLIERGEAMGVYAQGAGEKMRELIRDATNLASAYGEIPTEVTTTITANHVDNYTTNYSGGYGSSYEEPRALGGTTIAGSTSLVNERGIPEIVSVGNKDYLTMGSSNGTVTPLSEATKNNTVMSSGRYLGPSAREIGDAVAVALIRKGAIG